MNQLIKNLLIGVVSQKISEFIKKFQQHPPIINIYIVNNGTIQNLNIEEHDRSSCFISF